MHSCLNCVHNCDDHSLLDKMKCKRDASTVTLLVPHSLNYVKDACWTVTAPCHFKGEVSNPFLGKTTGTSSDVEIWEIWGALFSFTNIHKQPRDASWWHSPHKMMVNSAGHRTVTPTKSSLRPLAGGNADIRTSLRTTRELPSCLMKNTIPTRPAVFWYFIFQFYQIWFLFLTFWSDIWNVSYIELRILKSSKLWSSQLWTQLLKMRS